MDAVCWDAAGLAPLVRGLFLEAAGAPCVVAAPEAPKACEDCWTVELTAAAGGGDALDGAAAARLLREAATARFAGGALPSQVRLMHGGRSLRFGVGRDLAAARSGEGLPTAAVAADGRSAAGRDRVLEARIALVTGGAQGFGEEIVRGLAASGATVFVADLNQQGAEALCRDLNREQGREIAVAVGCNVADEASVEALFATVAATAGGLDLCVSNAGVLRAGSVLEQPLNDFRFVTEVNYTAFFLVARAAGRLFRRQHWTAPGWLTDLVQINSKSGLEGSNKNGAYAGGKFGGIGLVQSYALELIEHGVKVNAICPGNFFDGPLWSDPDRGLFVQYLRTGKVPGARTVADVKAFYEAKVPMGRGCEGADVMRALYYLVEQRYETGQALPVTGGQVMLH